MASQSRGPFRNSIFALGGLPAVVLIIITSCAEDEAVKTDKEVTPAAELPALENSLGMKFVPIKMPNSGQQDEDAIFYLQESEVTYEQYRKFKVAAGLATTAAETIPSDQPLAPQDFDSWADATKFVKQLSLWDKKHTYRLPTESEWEFACARQVGGQPVVRTRCENGGPANRWTRQFKPNPFGLYDMLGVYGEYCSDRFYEANDPIFSTGANVANVRVVRGMRQRTDKIGCYRYASDYRFPVDGDGRQTPTLVIGVRLVAQPKK